MYIFSVCQLIKSFRILWLLFSLYKSNMILWPTFFFVACHTVWLVVTLRLLKWAVCITFQNCTRIHKKYALSFGEQMFLTDFPFNSHKSSQPRLFPSWFLWSAKLRAIFVFLTKAMKIISYILKKTEDKTEGRCWFMSVFPFKVRIHCSGWRPKCKMTKQEAGGLNKFNLSNQRELVVGNQTLYPKQDMKNGNRQKVNKIIQKQKRKNKELI